MLLLLSMLHARIADLNVKMRSEEGATAVEYGIMVALIAVVIIATVVTIGTKLNLKFKTVADSL